MIVPLQEIAVFDECFTNVNMECVAKYRAAKWFPPIQLRPKNKRGFYVLADGNHRTMVTLLESRTLIEAELIDGGPVELSWRWPRIVPVLLYKQLLLEVGIWK